MCIRDRCEWAGVGAADALRPHAPDPARQGEPIPESLLGACLLYTSDAADERSSVDLGGRRIIKKKNKQVIDRRKYRHYNKIQSTGRTCTGNHNRTNREQQR